MEVESFNSPTVHIYDINLLYFGGILVVIVGINVEVVVVISVVVVILYSLFFEIIPKIMPVLKIINKKSSDTNAIAYSIFIKFKLAKQHSIA